MSNKTHNDEPDGGASDQKAGAQKEKSPSVLSVYLGPPAESKRRLEALDNLAKRLGLRGRSTLIQWIADERFMLVVPAQPFSEAAEHAARQDAGSDVDGTLKGGVDGAASSRQDKHIRRRTAESQLDPAVRQYIEEHIEQFARDTPGWHMELAENVIGEFGIPADEIDIYWKLVRDEAKQRGLYPYEVQDDQ